MTQHLAIFITIQFTKGGFMVTTSTRIVFVLGAVGPPMLPLVNFPINAFSVSIENESVPIQLARCCFPGLDISNAKMYFPIKYTEAILTNSTRKLLWF